MLKSLKQISEGAGIGMLGGLLIGITDSDWISLIIALALIAFTGNSLKSVLLNTDISPRQSFAGIAAFLAIPAGLFINGQKSFEQTPSKVIDKWVNAGFSPEEARAMYLKQWEWENHSDSEPSPAVQSLIKSMLDRMGPDEGKSTDHNNEINRQDSPREPFPPFDETENEQQVDSASG